MARELNSTERELVQELQKKWQEAETFRAPILKKWLHFHGNYHNYGEWRDQYQSAGPRDRYDGMQQATSTWGAQLFIPYSYRTVETTLPRMLAKPPRMQIAPAEGKAVANVQNMKALIDSQQDRADYDLTSQSTGKSGLIYGLGVQKAFWKLETGTRKRVAQRPVKLDGYSDYVVREGTQTLYDDPYAEDIDVFNWMWDPFGYDMNTIDWCVQRTWRSTGYCLDRLETGQWDYPLKTEDLEGTGSPQKWTESWSDRLRAQSLSEAANKVGQGNIHEVWEFHDHSRVCVILDRKWPVRVGENPAWHQDLPFAIYRPTEVPHQMVGKGEIEPIEDLQEELNTLRSQRRDNATVVLQRTFAYAEGFIDKRDLALGPGNAIPVTGGDPKDLIYPLPVGDIPNSGYREEDGLKQDIEMATGVSDLLAGGDVGVSGTTATAAQIGQDAVNQRVKLKTLRLLTECVRRVTQQWVELDQQKILSTKGFRKNRPPSPGEPDRAWEWVELQPEELWGSMEVRADAGNTNPDNIPQMRQDGLQLWQMFGQDPAVDHVKLQVEVMRLMGLQHPETYIKPQGPPIPPEAIDNIIQVWTQEMTSLAQGMIQQGLRVDDGDPSGATGKVVKIDPQSLPKELQNPDVVIRQLVGEAIQQASQKAGIGPPQNGGPPLPEQAPQQGPPPQ